MEISLRKANVNDAHAIHTMQLQAFMPLLKKYEDYDTSPANEAVDRIIARLNQPFTDYYIIKHLDCEVGAIRIVSLGSNVYRVSPVFILPEHQGKGMAQKVFAKIENIYSDAAKWELGTILQEQGNCYLYEKLGYQRLEKTKVINDKMTIVFYEKYITDL